MPWMSALDKKNREDLSRLSIGHLLILTLTCSISLALIAPALHSAWNMPDESYRGSKLAPIAATAVDHLVMGLKLFGLGVLIRERFRSRLIRLSPGHWYFIIAGPIAAFLLMSEMLPHSIHPRWPIFDRVFDNVIY